ncbi:MAG: hypothetical protein LBV72_08420 [Tannerella sp.]|jgi:hypothetical protein|nr:hypothetical protein [Tannerella sp.]
MDTQKLQDFINEFDEEQLKENAFFGIYQYGGGSDESYVEANKEGLLVFAIQFLKATIKAEEALANFEMSREFPFKNKDNWYDEDCQTQIDYIQLAEEKSKYAPQKEYKETLLNKIEAYGCITLIITGIIILIVAAGIGVITMLKWLF